MVLRFTMKGRFTMKKIFKYFVVTTLILATVAPTSVMAASQHTEISSSTSYDIQPRDILEWYYKEENGRLYKRLFNHGTKKWVTDWMLVG